jgi:hypothetical protein
MSVLNLGEPTAITIVYEVIAVRHNGWHITYRGPSRYAAASEYNNTEPPKRMLAIGRTGGTVMHESPETGESNPAI